uniref:non-specific serine/threonine protein kinase n=1 Tax=Graphocephala atropunctata TaxID=36148 RepID=A0A1B6KHC2_9HEMI
MIPISSNRREAVKYLEDVGLSISSKNTSNAPSKPPPKIRGKHFLNLDFLADASFVWLTPDEKTSFPSDLYVEKVNSTYFEQCFIPVEKLGEGSFGFVIKVIGKEDSKFYAMKVSKEPFRNECDRKWKLNEVDSHKLVSKHPNIVTLYNAWEEDRYLHMQLELCKTNLGKGYKTVSEAQCWNILIDIVLALDHIHDLGMGHFDVKLENILCGYDGLYKLSDFGLVYHFEKDSTKMPKEGDAKYMAPELLASKKDFTTKADIFSLGITILELAGNLCLPSNGEVWKALREDTFPFLQTKDLSDDLFYLLKKMMSPEAPLRPSAKEILSLPIVKTILMNRNSNSPRRQLDCKGIWNDNMLPYFATWVYFSYLVMCMVRNIVSSTYPENAMEVEVFPTRLFQNILMRDSTSNESAILRERNCSSGYEGRRRTFTTSSPIPVASVVAESTASRCKTRRLESSSCALSGIRNESFFSLTDSSLNSSSQSTPSTSNNSSDGSMGCLSPSTSQSYIALGPSFGDQSNMHVSPSLIPFGVSPIRLSNELKEVVMARRKRKMLPARNLIKSFEECDQE